MMQKCLYNNFIEAFFKLLQKR